MATGLCFIGGSGLLCVLLAGDLLWKKLHDGTMLVLTVSAASLVLGCHFRHVASEPPLRGSGWLRSCGRLSYEIYLTHMFVVFAVVACFKATSASMRGGFWWYPPTVAICWLLGALVARGFSEPAHRALLSRFARGPRRRSPTSR